MAELGIATLTSCFVNANRDPKKGKPASPKDFFYFAPKDKADDVKISATAANIFFSLIRDDLMPDWVIGMAPIEKLRESRNGKPIQQPRALIGDGILLIMPKINDRGVRFSLGFVSRSGLIEAKDADTGAEFVLMSENDSPTWILDGELKYSN